MDCKRRCLVLLIISTATCILAKKNDSELQDYNILLMPDLPYEPSFSMLTGGDTSLRRGTIAGQLQAQSPTLQQLLSHLQHGLSSHMYVAHGNHSEVSAKCASQLKGYAEALERGADWAVLMADSSGRWDSGIHSGHWFAMGKYRQCREIRRSDEAIRQEMLINGAVSDSVRSANSDTKVITSNAKHPARNVASYSFITLNLRAEIKELKRGVTTAYLGLCLPSACGRTDVYHVMKSLVQSSPSTASHRHVTGIKVRTVKPNSIWNDSAALLALQVVGLVMLMVIGGTLYDSYSSVNDTKDKSLWQEILVSFSASRCLRIFELKGKTATASSNTIPHLHAMRVLSLCWTIFGHTFLYTMSVLDRPLTVDAVARVPYQPVVTMVGAVDCCFFLSGFLLAYNFFRKGNAHTWGPLQWAWHVWNRYWRMTVAYSASIFILELGVMRFVADSPLWPPEDLHAKCTGRWWRNLLYVHGFDSVGDMCMSWSWSQTSEMLFFLVGSLLLFIATKYSVIRAAVCGCAVIGVSYIWVATTAFVNDFTLRHELFINYTLLDYLNNFHMSPWFHISSYLIGMAFGYAFLKKPEIFQLGWFLTTCMWIYSAIVLTIVVFGLSFLNLNNLISTALLTSSRSVWAIAIGWLVVACSNGRAGFIRHILSWEGWAPFSQITYSAFLVHSHFLAVGFFGREAPVHFDLYNIFSNALGFMLLSYSFGIIFYTLFEGPSLNVGQLMYKRIVAPRIAAKQKESKNE